MNTGELRISLHISHMWAVDDTVINMLQKAHSSLDKSNWMMQIMFCDISSAFNTIQPTLLKDKLEDMQADDPMVT